MSLEQQRREALDRFNKNVIKRAKYNLTRKKKNASKKLYNSIKGEVNVSRNSFGMFFLMEDYGEFQDKGVKGVKSGRSEAGYSFKSKMPPPATLDKWIVRRGIAPRDKSGKFMSRKSIAFAIARSIYNKGIEPSRFFTDAFEGAFKKLPNELVTDFGLRVEEQFLYMLDNGTEKK